MNIYFQASKISADIDPDYWIVGFADLESDTDQYLLLQRAKVIEQQDIDLGHAIYHVEVNDQSCSCYGGIERAMLWRNRIEIAFAPQVSAAMKKIMTVVVKFDVDNFEFSTLNNQLAFIFSGTDVFRHCE
jgi:hypothetical protein